MLSRQTLKRIFIEGGIRPGDSESKARAIRLSNVIGLSAIVNTLLFGVVAWFYRDWLLLRVAVYSTSIYAFSYGLTIAGFSKIGRPLNVLSGCAVIFWGSCYFRGDSLLQLFFYILSVAPFMYFSWEERINYWLMIVPVACLVVAEGNHYEFFERYDPSRYTIAPFRWLSLLTPLNQIVMGFLFFLKQSVKFENESKENLRKLEIEHQRQIQVHKMVSLGVMSAGVAHEINNPLTVIHLQNFILRKDLCKSPPDTRLALKSTQLIEASVNRIVKIINSLHLFSSNTSSDAPAESEVNQIVQDAINLFARRFEEARIELVVQVEESLKLKCRPAEISQVLMNLLNNSFDAVVGSQSPKIEIKAKKRFNGEVEIRVEDNGSGIPINLRERVFEPFFTTKEIGKGSGLGLSVSKGIIESNGGTLALVSGTERTTFEMVFGRPISC